MTRAAVRVRSAVPGDERTIFDLVRALAVYEKLEHAVTGSAEELAQHLFGARPAAEVLLAEVAGRAVGYALFFTTYSTFLTKPGVYLEDLFVLETERRYGVGSALFSEVVRLSKERGAGRLEWAVLDWNAPALAFYERMGAQLLPEWRLCRIAF